MLHVAPVLLLALLTASCGDGSRRGDDDDDASDAGDLGGEGEGEGDAGADGDADADGDTDADGDGDADVPAEYDGLPGEFTLDAGGRAARLYVPSGYSHDVAIPLVVGFHGAGDDGANFYQICAALGFLQAAEPASFILLIPDTRSPYADFAVWSGNPNDDVDEMAAEMDEILALIDETSTHYHVDATQLHAFGFSDGGLFTAVAGMGESETFASLSVCGFGWGASYPLVAPARLVPTQFVCGTADGFCASAVDSEAFLSQSGHPTRIETVAGAGHRFSELMTAVPPSDLFAWMQDHPL